MSQKKVTVISLWKTKLLKIKAGKRETLKALTPKTETVKPKVTRHMGMN